MGLFDLFGGNSSSSSSTSNYNYSAPSTVGEVGSGATALSVGAGATNVSIMLPDKSALNLAALALQTNLVESNNVIAAARELANQSTDIATFTAKNAFQLAGNATPTLAAAGVAQPVAADAQPAPAGFTPEQWLYLAGIGIAVVLAVKQLKL